MGGGRQWSVHDVSALLALLWSLSRYLPFPEFRTLNQLVMVWVTESEDRKQTYVQARGFDDQFLERMVGIADHLRALAILDLSL